MTKPLVTNPVVGVVMGQEDVPERHGRLLVKLLLYQPRESRRDEGIDEENGRLPDHGRAVGAVARGDPFSSERPDEDVLAGSGLGQRVWRSLRHRFAGAAWSTNSRICAACSSGFTFGQTAAIFPLSSIR